MLTASFALAAFCYERSVYQVLDSVVGSFLSFDAIPLSLRHQYKVGQLYMIAKHSFEETHDGEGEGIEVCFFVVEAMFLHCTVIPERKFYRRPFPTFSAMDFSLAHFKVVI